MTNLWIGVAIAALVGVYVWLRRSQKHRKANLLAVSEDVNLPAKPEEMTNVKAQMPNQTQSSND